MIPTLDLTEMRCKNYYKIISGNYQWADWYSKPQKQIPWFFHRLGKKFSFINKSTISVKARETFGIFYVKAIDYLNP